MALASSLTKQTSKFVPASKGIIQNSITGVGADKIFNLIDNLIGGPAKRLFSFNLPFVGPIGVIDAINYVAHANGFKVSKKGITAVLAAKIVNGGLQQLGPISLPSFGSSTGVTNPVSAENGGPI